ncbi:hypothetical protein GQ55_5G065800 [Panicum hallii var. hallii]|uniref:AP2/ERF domain-containing protein n=1 Tax=Panicum hallii var. hallii TaxID=1504633 RepID=A0A2T7DDH3_9POAL|nr:hypothetical protein GQ55_5G065800 [Panicum hallii var. hallii]
MRRAERGDEQEAERRRGYKGVRRRRWGKWVSEIRVPGTRGRLWLGSYATPEAAAVAHDTAVYFLRGGAGAGVAAGGDIAALNFPERAAAAYGAGAGVGGAGAGAGRLSPQSVQRMASDAGMAADAQLVAARDGARAPAHGHADCTGIGSAQGGGPSARPRDQDADAYTSRARATSNSAGASREQQHPVSGEISVDDIEVLV